MPIEKTPVAIVGASGYTGAELVRILARHPGVTIASASARRAAGQRLTDVFPHLRGGDVDLAIDGFDPDAIAKRVKLAFTALPHGDSASAVAALHARGVIVLDLSADFRLRDRQAWATWYSAADMPEHPAPALLADPVS